MYMNLRGALECEACQLTALVGQLIEYVNNFHWYELLRVPNGG